MTHDDIGFLEVAIDALGVVVEALRPVSEGMEPATASDLFLMQIRLDREAAHLQELRRRLQEARS